MADECLHMEGGHEPLYILSPIFYAWALYLIFDYDRWFPRDASMPHTLHATSYFSYSLFLGYDTSFFYFQIYAALI